MRLPSGKDRGRVLALRFLTVASLGGGWGGGGVELGPSLLDLLEALPADNHCASQSEECQAWWLHLGKR